MSSHDDPVQGRQGREARDGGPPADKLRQRIATIDWMRGLVMVLMIMDHPSMAFDRYHLDHDSAWYPDAATMGYRNMFLPRADGCWQQWLHVSKYPPSLTYASLELGILFLCLAFLRTIEPKIGVRENGPFFVFGQTAMFFYLVHRLAFEIPATYFGLRSVGGLGNDWAIGLVMLVLMYPACLWYRAFKAAHPTSILKYL